MFVCMLSTHQFTILQYGPCILRYWNKNATVIIQHDFLHSRESKSSSHSFNVTDLMIMNSSGLLCKESSRFRKKIVSQNKGMCSHWQRPRPRPIKSGLCRIMCVCVCGGGGGGGSILTMTDTVTDVNGFQTHFSRISVSVTLKLFQRNKLI